MRRLTAWIGLGCGLALLLFFYRSVLFQGQQFGFRDAGQYYYPLHARVQAEWNAGRWPLWDPSENAGMPLLGNPTAAVLYPGKVIYAALPYAWAARLYAVAHSVLAFAGMLALMRSWGTSWAGSTIAGLSYTFGGPVVFQYCNIIFLVGAAWIPWGLLAIDRWLRLGRPGSLAALAVVLAMQVLGGDPESAYLLGLCSGGYAAGLAWVGRHGPWRVRARAWVPLAVVGVVAWVAITLFLAAKLPGFRPEPGEKPWGPISRWIASGKVPVFRPQAFEGPVPSLPWTSWVPRVVAGAWALAGLVLAYRWWRRGSSSVPLVPKLAGLAASAVLAGALSAAQMVPAAEFTGLSGRATDEGNHDIYPFSLEPYRLVEMVWPGVFGRSFGQPVMWMDVLVPSLSHRVWVPSLYLGGLASVLALGAAGFRGGPPWRAWLTGIAAVSLIGSFGEFASPLAIARLVPEVAEAMGHPPWTARLVAQARTLGPNDARNTNAVRLDGYLRDGDGSPYFLMAEFLPGFGQFRFPSKLLSFTVLAVAGLAGLGWDRAREGRSRWPGRLALLGSGATLVLLAVVFAHRGRFEEWLGRLGYLTIFGPLDAPAAVVDTQLALIQGAAVLASAGGLIALARRRAELAGVLALLVMTVDLGLANPSLIRTVPQSDFEESPKVLRLIAEAERADPSPGPYRVHRMPIWSPSRWKETVSPDRVRDFVRWEHDTIQPKYGLLHDVEYTHSIGVAELYDYSWFFAPFPRMLREEGAHILGLPTGEQVVVYPRRGYDLWNSRYFVLPALPRWDDADRGIASFLVRAERIYPPADVFSARSDDPRVKHWLEVEDFQILRNTDAFPRAWIVHEARFKPPIVGLTRGTRRETMEEILFSNDPFWSDPTRAYFDARRVAWIEVDDPFALAGYVSNSPPLAGDSVKVVAAESGPQKVVLDVNLARPGLVILSDVFYPGWKLTIDGQPAPILRANRAMRGAAVKAEKHRLVYTYEPRSFRVGAAVSLGGLVVLAGFSAWSFRRGRMPA
jgi:hypothetical protein